jgi:hypothetical protein
LLTQVPEVTKVKLDLRDGGTVEIVAGPQI